MTNEIIEKAKELASDSTFVARAQNTSSVEEYQQLLKEYGVDTTVEELQAGIDKIASFIGEDGELTPEAMDMVAGGRVNWVTNLGLGGQVGCTLAMMSCVSNPLGWFVAATGCGVVALTSMFF